MVLNGFYWVMIDRFDEKQSIAEHVNGYWYLAGCEGKRPKMYWVGERIDDRSAYHGVMKKVQS